MKEEMEEELKRDEAWKQWKLAKPVWPFFHFDVATQDREIQKRDKAAKSQTATEPEPKPVAKRRRWTRRDMQQIIRQGAQA